MIAEQDISWASYKNDVLKKTFEGPFFRGSQKFVRPPNPSETDKIIEVISATEGGCYDSYNGYDGQYGSLGLIQCTEKGGHLLSALLCAAVEASPFQVQNWLYFTLEGMGLTLDLPTRRLESIDGKLDSRAIFYKDSDGTKGSWDEDSKTWAKRLAATLCSLFEVEGAKKGQRQYLGKIIDSFAVGSSHMYIADARAEGSPLALAFVAAYLSFAVNNPARAAKGLRSVSSSAGKEFSRGWLNEVLYTLTFAPKIAIYPHRYNAIRPKLEELYGISLPDFASELEAWKAVTKHTLLDPREVQMALVNLGYDIGPFGADGVMGPDSAAALRKFEEDHGIPQPDGVVDEATARALEEALRNRKP